MAGFQQQSTINLGLSEVPEIDVKQYPTLWSELLRIRNALKILAGTVDVYTGAQAEDSQYWNQTAPANSIRIQNIARIYVKVGVSLSGGNLCHFYNDAGILKARPANATDATKPARAVCMTAGTQAVDSFAEFNLFGALSIYTGLTPGATYYLSTVDGSATTTAPTGGTTIQQPVGYALSATTMYFNPQIR